MVLDTATAAKNGCIMRFITSEASLKPCLVKYFKWLLKVIKGKRAGKEHILFSDQSTEGTYCKPKRHSALL